MAFARIDSRMGTNISDFQKVRAVTRIMSQEEIVTRLTGVERTMVLITTSLLQLHQRRETVDTKTVLVQAAMNQSRMWQNTQT